MDWSGDFVFGPAWAVFRGTAADNTPHSHPTLQIVLAPCAQAEIEVPPAQKFLGAALVVRPGTVHLLRPIEQVTLIFVEPQTAVASWMLGDAPAGPVIEAPSSVICALANGTCLSDLMEQLLERAAPAPAHVDPCVERALHFLSTANGARSITRAAAEAGMSPSRLRERARRQLGTPLSSWLMWRRLERAGAALASGAGLAEAAVEAGFADQSHLTRATRQVFGITPGMASGVVGPQQANRSRPH